MVEIVGTLGGRVGVEEAADGRPEPVWPPIQLVSTIMVESQALNPRNRNTL
jgi:hypothetical protein